MSDKLDTKGVNPRAAEVIGRFYMDVMARGAGRVHSIHVTGSAVTDDFVEGSSDVNSIVVLEEMDFAFLDAVASLGKSYGKRHVRAPLVMTPGYIESSLDSFPIEFLDAKLIHKTIYGRDVLAGLEISRADLRLAAERDLKAGLVTLRQGYLRALGSAKRMNELLTSAISGMIALFRAVIVLKDAEPPTRKADVLRVLDEVTVMDLSPFRDVLAARLEGDRLAGDASVKFREVYDGFVKLAEELDALKA